MFFRLLKEGFLFAVNSVIINKLRTFLSLFGITIGIFSIISVFTVLDWMEKAVHDTISSLGENIIYIHKYPWGLNTDPNLKWWDIIKWPNMSKDDYQAVLNKSEKSASVAFTISQTEQIKYKKNIASYVPLMAVTQDYEKVRSFEIENGRYFSPEESATGKNVAILGYEIATKLFEKSDPIDKQITIGGRKAYVIGVFKKEGTGGITDSGMDNVTIIPLDYAKSFINMRNYNLDATLMVRAKKGIAIEELSDEATMILRASRRLQPDETSNFFVNQASTITQSFDTVFAGINIGGWIIGGFAILVGGFGIANIMFVSVRERTNQIGIQKALGAKRSFILLQFLVESVMLSVIGGLLGVFLVFIASLVINYVYELNMYLTFANVLLAVFISGIIGVVAGYAPAYSAARMNPVEAIGYSFT
jgi:putative ABC transport system permease protein